MTASLSDRSGGRLDLARREVGAVNVGTGRDCLLSLRVAEHDNHTDVRQTSDSRQTRVKHWSDRRRTGMQTCWHDEAWALKGHDNTESNI